jgi:hypothetical protein
VVLAGADVCEIWARIDVMRKKKVDNLVSDMRFLRCVNRARILDGQIKGHIRQRLKIFGLKIL